MSTELAKRGHTVFLFCSCEDEHIYKGVYYIPYENLEEYTDMFPDALITSRWFPQYYFDAGCKKIVWFQDAFFQNPDRPDSFLLADHIICSSRWHRQYIAERLVHSLDGRKIQIVPLGIRKELFTKAVERKPYKVIYSSNPDRGLYTLLDMWEEITKQVPQIELSICYGWDGLKTWNNSNEWQASVANQERTTVEGFSKFGNVTFTGRLSKSKLAEEMLSSSLCLYPNNFWETFCLTSLEMQAAGVPTITTDMGALSTTLKRDCNVLIEKDHYSKEYKEEFIQYVVYLLNNPSWLHGYSSDCRNYVFSNPTDWSDIASTWEEVILCQQ